MIAGVSAFLAVFVSGTVLVSLLSHADAGSGNAAVSPSRSPSGSPQPEPGPSLDAYVAWVPGGLPPGYGSQVAALPTILLNQTSANFFFGGTSILIVIGVALDTMKQLEAQLMMRNYEGFLK